MKKKNIIIIIAVLIIALIIAAVLIFAKPAAQPEGAKKTGKQDEKQTDVETTTPAPEPTSQTIVIDDDQKITATLGVETVSGEDKDTQPTQEPTSTAAPEVTPPPTEIIIPDDPKTLSYEDFYALSPEKKDEFLHSFENYDLFYEWLVDAQAKFTKEHPDIEIGPGGSIDLSQLQR